jgi:hypothetical protein
MPKWQTMRETHTMPQNIRITTITGTTITGKTSEITTTIVITITVKISKIYGII